MVLDVSCGLWLGRRPCSLSVRCAVLMRCSFSHVQVAITRDLQKCPEVVRFLGVYEVRAAPLMQPMRNASPPAIALQCAFAGVGVQIQSLTCDSVSS